MRDLAPAETKVAAVALDPFDGQSEPVANPLPDQKPYSTDFQEILEEQPRQSWQAPVPNPMQYLSDDARHAPALLAGSLACLLAVGTAMATWTALNPGVAPSGAEAGLARLEQRATPSTGIAVLLYADGEALPPAIALLPTHAGALPPGNALRAFLDVALMRAAGSDQPGIATAASLTTPSAGYALIPKLMEQPWATEDEPETADQLPTHPTQVEFPGKAPPEGIDGENGKEWWRTFGSIATASLPAPSGNSEGAGNVAAPAPGSTDTSGGSDPSPSDQGKRKTGGKEGNGGDADGPGSQSKGSGGKGKDGKSNGANGEHEKGMSAKGESDKGDGSNGESDQAGSDKGKDESSRGDKGKGNKDKGDKEKGGKGKGGKEDR